MPQELLLNSLSPSLEEEENLPTYAINDKETNYANL